MSKIYDGQKCLLLMPSPHLCCEGVDRQCLGCVVHSHVAWACEPLDQLDAGRATEEGELTGRAAPDVREENLRFEMQNQTPPHLSHG